MSLFVDGAQDQSGVLKAADPQGVSRSLFLPANMLSGQGTGSNAAADLAAGTLRLDTVGHTDHDPALDMNTAHVPMASARFQDKITVAGPGTTVSMTATLDVDGDLIVTGAADNDHGQFQMGVVAQVGLGSGQTQMSALHELFVSLPQTPLSDILKVNPVALPSHGSASSSGVQLHVEYAVDVPIGQSTNVFAQLFTTSGVMTPGYAGRVSFGNTARFALSLPAGYTYTSESGLLLSQAGGPGLPLVDDGGVGVGGDGGAPLPTGTDEDAGGNPASDAGPGAGGSGSGSGADNAGSNAGSSAGSDGGCGVADVGGGSAGLGLFLG
ncbi:MAG: hypothetical protein ABI551_13580, partial [Polyangiaceae bacterium]